MPYLVYLTRLPRRNRFREIRGRRLLERRKQKRGPAWPRFPVQMACAADHSAVRRALPTILRMLSVDRWNFRSSSEMDRPFR